MSIFVDKVHAENILQQLWQDCEKEELYDVVLIAENDEIRIPAHRNILSAASKYFKGMFQSSMRETSTKEIKISSVNGATLRSLIGYCYTGRVAITEEMAVEILKLADLLLLRNVVIACGNFLSEQLDSSNCLGLALFAEQYRCDILQQKAKDYSLKHFMDVAKSHEFLNLNLEQVVEFLANDNLCVPAEEKIFEILMTWIQHDQIERMKYKDQLLKLVRFPLLEPSFLIKQVKPICTSMENFQLYVDALESRYLPDHKIINARKSIDSDTFLMCLTHNSENTEMKINFYCPQRLKWMRCLKDLECRYAFGAAVMHDNLCVVGGAGKNMTALNTVICINLKTMNIDQINPMLESRNSCGAAVLNGMLYVVGGYNGSKQISSVEKWNPQTNTWTKVASMSEHRYGFCIAQLNDKLYAIGGYCDGRALSSGEYYDIHKNVWKSIAPMNKCPPTPEIAVANGLIYIVGGSRTIERYDPQTNKWTILISLLQSVYWTRFSSTFWNNVIACSDDQFYEYNDKTNEWETKEILNGIKNVCCLITYSGELLTSEFAEN